MHTTEITDDAGTWTFIHDGDASGDVRIVTPDLLTPDLVIEVDTLIEFVGRLYGDTIISKVEQMSGIQLLDELAKRIV